MKLVKDPVPTKNYKQCGCAISEYPDGRKLYHPCIPCGLMQAGAALVEASNSWWHRRKHLRMAGAALAAVATTINTAATDAKAVSKAVEDIAQDVDDE
jgi:hypothetical protein